LSDVPKAPFCGDIGHFAAGSNHPEPLPINGISSLDIIPIFPKNNQYNFLINSKASVIQTLWTE
jgi:hypothetical protein